MDLTAELARHEKDCYVKKTLDFALLEDFDHLYRYANLLEAEQGIYAEKLVGRYTEIMPGRPTISHHRYPVDNVRRSIDSRTADGFGLHDHHGRGAADDELLYECDEFCHVGRGAQPL